MLQTFTVEPATLVLLKKLQAIEEFKNLRLVGGTALSLMLGHRESVDLDLFGSHNLDVNQLLQVVSDAGIEVSLQYDTKSIMCCYCNGVKVDFVKYDFVKWLKEPLIIDDIRLASLEDIAAMKLNAVTGRGTKKDFIDLYFLMRKFTLDQMLRLFVEKYPKIAPILLAKSMTYFIEADQTITPRMFEEVSWEEVKAYIVKQVEKL